MAARSAALSGEPDPDARRLDWERRFRISRYAGSVVLHTARTAVLQSIMNACDKGDHRKAQSLIKKYEKEHRKFHRAVRLEIHKVLKHKVNGLWIDGYCGTGEFTQMMKSTAKAIVGVEWVDPLAVYAHDVTGIEIWQRSFLEAISIQESYSVGAVSIINGLLHSPDATNYQLLRTRTGEKEETLRQVARALKRQGWLFVCEMLQEDIPQGRKLNPGAFYWSLADFDKHLSALRLERKRISDPISLEGDPCRLLAYRK